MCQKQVQTSSKRMNVLHGRGIFAYLQLGKRLYASGYTNTRRFFASGNVQTERSVVLEEVTRQVKPFGKVVVRVPCDVEVRPVDFERYPDANVLLVRVITDEIDGAKVTAPTSMLAVNSDTEDVWAVTSQNCLPVNAKCLIETPIRFDVDVLASGCNEARVSGMISKSIMVKTASGNITGEKLQAEQMLFSSSSGGSVDLRRTLHGNIEINTIAEGVIRGEKFLGTELNVTTQNGDVHIGSSYCTKSCFRTTNGTLMLDNLHMEARVHIPGNGVLNILCLDGALDATLNSGSARVRVVRLTGNSVVRSEGDVELVVAEENPVQLNLKAHRLDVDTGLNGMEEHGRNVQKFKTFVGDSSLSVTTIKSIRVSLASWASTLNLERSPR